MPRYPMDIPMGVGDVIVTREGPWYVSAAIRLGAWLMKRPAKCNHVIIVHHQDADGRWWGIEGRPGGVGWIELTIRLGDTLTNANNAQPKSEEQRYLVAVASESLLGVAYDWTGIAGDVKQAVGVQRRFWLRVREWKEDETPAQVVCSSFADWAYEKVGMPNPGGYQRTRMTTPGDWDKFMINKEWNNP